MPDENPSGLGAFDLPLRLPGQRYDKETNLAQNWFRDYDAAIGRYTRSDPIGLAGGLSTYAYVLGDPLANFDSKGLDTLSMIPMLDNPPRSPEVCRADYDCPSPVTITTTSTACQPGDTICAQAMQSAGIQGPYVPQSKTYSGECLLKFGVGFTGGKTVVGTVLINQAPNIASRMGASALTVSRVTAAVSVLNSLPAMTVGATAAIAIVLSRCECPVR